MISKIPNESNSGKDGSIRPFYFIAVDKFHTTAIPSFARPAHLPLPFHPPHDLYRLVRDGLAKVPILAVQPFGGDHMGSNRLCGNARR